MYRRDSRLSSEIGPQYRRVVTLVRDRITSGEYPVGGQIPSTVALHEQTGLSVTVIRRAVQELQESGILEGHPGKGVFVRALPENADRERADLKSVAGQVADLAEHVKQYDDLRARVGRMEAILINLHARLGFPNPYGGERDGTEKAPRRGRAGR